MAAFGTYPRGEVISVQYFLRPDFPDFPREQDMGYPFLGSHHTKNFQSASSRPSLYSDEVVSTEYFYRGPCNLDQRNEEVPVGYVQYPVLSSPTVQPSRGVFQPWLGLKVDWKQRNVATVKEVTDGSPASEASIKAEDRLISWDGTMLTSEEIWNSKLATVRVGSKINLVIERGGQRYTVPILIEGIPSASRPLGRSF